MKNEVFDIAILGSGPGGYIAALRAAQLGFKTVIVEKERIGGMSLNWGVIPSKSLIASAELYQNILKAKSFGLKGIEFQNVKPDWLLMNRRAQKIASTYTSGIEKLLKKNGIKIFKGQGNVLNKNTLQVNDTNITFENLIIATGSSYPKVSNMEDVSNFHTPKTIYSMEKLPESMIIVGAGVIGVEFALLFSAFGVDVRLIDRSSCFMPYLDHDMYQALLDTLKNNNVKLSLESTVREMSSAGVVVEQNGKKDTFKADIYLSAVTRKASLTGLENLIDHGMELDNGYIRTDSRSRTTLPNIYAIGDVNGRFMLVHVAAKEAVAAVETIHGSGKDIVYDLMPYNLYANPEFSSVGLTEAKAREQGFLVETQILPNLVNGKAIAADEQEGFIKVVYEKKSGEILGVHIVAHNATDLINEAVIAMQVKSSIWEVAFAIHPHPTMSEAYLEAAMKAIQKR